MKSDGVTHVIHGEIKAKKFFVGLLLNEQYFTYSMAGIRYI
jgi:hypothetical protein